MKFKLIVRFTLLLLAFGLLTSCKKNITYKNINEILLSIKNYTCSMSIEVYSNKNSSLYSAIQSYSFPDKYSMSFENSSEMQISYLNNILSISNSSFNISESIPNYENINCNPLFLSYFLNLCFSSEDSNTLNSGETYITLLLPENNPYLYSATLTAENGLPKSLTYFDKNGIIKVNIIYSEFKLISS